MVGTLTSIYRGEESLPIQGICARYHGRPARACWGQYSRSVAQPAEYFRGEARAIGTFPGKRWAVRYRTTAPRSPYHHFCLAQRLQHEANVMKLPRKKSLLLLNSPRLLLTSSFLLKISPSLPFLFSIYRTLYHALSDTSLHMHVHAHTTRIVL